jgi:hypothetical protein
MHAKARRHFTLLHCVLLLFAVFCANPAIASSNSKHGARESNSGQVVPVNPARYVEHIDKFL